jgi:hypothetical protein
VTAQIINLADYRKAKEAEQVRKVVNDYFAAHSQIMAWWLSGTPAGYESANGTSRTSGDARLESAKRAKADIEPTSLNDRI